MFNDWKLDNGKTIRLMTPAQIKKLAKKAPGSIVYDINGVRRRVGAIRDFDTRYGYTAYGKEIKR